MELKIWLDGSPLSIAGLIIGSLVVYITYSRISRKRKLQYWKDRGVPGPEEQITISGDGKTPAVDYYVNNQNKYGKVFGGINGTTPVLVVSDLDLIKQMTVKDFYIFPDRVDIRDMLGKTLGGFVSRMHGEEWKRMRTILSPTFTLGKMKKMFSRIDSCCQDAILAVRKRSPDGDVDLKQFFLQYSLDVIARCLFATNADPYNNTKGDFVQATHRLFTPNMRKMKLFFLLPRWLFKLLGIVIFDNGAVEYLQQLTLHIVKERKRSGVRQDDFVQLLIDASTGMLSSSDELNATVDELFVPDTSSLKSRDKSPLTDEEIVSQSILFIQAGHETTATLLSYLFYELALHPAVQEQLHQELTSLTDFSYESINKSPYLEAVVNETLRMHPPALVLDRVASQDYKVPGTDIVMPRGCQLQIPILAVHYDEGNYSNPHKFDPERFLPANRDQLKPLSFLPFGSGPRSCIGSRFALLETKLMVTRTVLALRAVQTDKTPVPLKYGPPGALLKVEPMLVKFESR
ncbi:Cytochrome P450 3A12 [Halotydeus destructor]|nr:Cytochrome P450 3A12 [Halotydeus destructor]